MSSNPIVVSSCGISIDISHGFLKVHQLKFSMRTLTINKSTDQLFNRQFWLILDDVLQVPMEKWLSANIIFDQYRVVLSRPSDIKQMWFSNWKPVLPEKLANHIQILNS
jgi:hypothetical protein